MPVHAAQTSQLRSAKLFLFNGLLRQHNNNIFQINFKRKESFQLFFSLINVAHRKKCFQYNKCNILISSFSINLILKV
jgi:hypothetical protein